MDVSSLECQNGVIPIKSPSRASITVPSSSTFDFCYELTKIFSTMSFRFRSSLLGSEAP
jgi:hypothetical protein